MRIVVVGTGYVGLVTGACLAEIGHNVTCVDIDEQKINGLKNGIIPIYEPGLESLIKKNYQDGRLEFATTIPSPSINKQTVYFIAVGTPSNSDGTVDISYIWQVAKELGKNITEYCVVVNKSTVPVGTGAKIKEIIKSELANRGIDFELDFVSNPEFLKQGDAVNDFMKPDRVIIGTNSEKAALIMKQIYAPLTRNRDRILFMDVKSAEMTKYAANAMLASRISFMNEIALLCEELGVDVENIRKGIGSDSRIGYSFLYSGCGYGGSCFPKDVKGLISMAKENNLELGLIESIERRNKNQKTILIDKIQKRFGQNLEEYVFCVWGLSFKPETDDMREAPSRSVITKLIESGAKVKAFDPITTENAKKIFPKEWFDKGILEFVNSQYFALKDANALILLTEWRQFLNPDFFVIKDYLKHPIIFDGRNQYDPQYMHTQGIEYYGIGRGTCLYSQAN